VVMMLRVQLERQRAGFFPSLRKYARLYGLDGRRLDAMADHAIVMHPGPMNRGVEIAAEGADSIERSVIADQVANGISVRMALLYLLLGGPEVTAGRSCCSRAGDWSTRRRGSTAWPTWSSTTAGWPRSGRAWWPAGPRSWTATGWWSARAWSACTCTSGRR